MRVRTIGLIGAGTIGQGIAQVVASSSIQVHVLEISRKKGEEALAQIEMALDSEIARWGMTETEKKVLLSRISLLENIEGLARSSFVIEAVGEDFERKSQVLRRAREVCGGETLLASSLSTLSVSELGEAIGASDRVIGLHFHHPVPKMKLVEIVRGLRTSDETYARAAEFVRQLGKTPIDVTEFPGLVTTRCIIPFINEAIHIVMEGVASPRDVDRAMCLGYNLERGPLTMADEMGLDQVLSWMEHLFHELGEVRYRACPLLRKMVRAGHLGVKTGRGFFQYNGNGKKVPTSAD